MNRRINPDFDKRPQPKINPLAVAAVIGVTLLIGGIESIADWLFF